MTTATERPPFPVNETGLIDRRFGPCVEERKRLGTKAVALLILKLLRTQIEGDECHGMVHHCRSRFLCDSISNIEEALNRCPRDVAGDPKDVSYLKDPRHEVGYIIFVNLAERLECDVLEALRTRIRILRSGDEIIAVEHGSIGRHESGDGKTYF